MSRSLLFICAVAGLACGSDESRSPSTSTESAMPAPATEGAPPIVSGGEASAMPALPGTPSAMATDGDTPSKPEGASSGNAPGAGDAGSDDGRDASAGETDTGDAGTDVPDTGSDASDGGTLEECPPPDALDCNETPRCCQGSACVESDDCATGCCLPVDAEGGVCAATPLCEAPPIVGCTDVILRAADGTFLGNATSFPTAESLCNPASPFGSAASPTSIFNPFGTYGNTFGTQSAYTSSTLTPPVLICAATETPLNPVTKNATLLGAIDPDVLCAALAANGI